MRLALQVVELFRLVLQIPSPNCMTSVSIYMCSLYPRMNNSEHFMARSHVYAVRQIAAMALTVMQADRRDTAIPVTTKSTQQHFQ